MLFVARRAYDEHASHRDRAAASVNPRAIRHEKDLAQGRFHQALAKVQDRAARDAAATVWLDDINALNAQARETAAWMTRESVRAATLLAEFETAAKEADRARLAALRAEADCRTARETLAACEERERLGPHSISRPVPTRPAGEVRHAEHAEHTQPDAIGGWPFGRLLRGDHATLTALVDALAGDDAEARGRWQLLLSDLVDAIVARAIETTSLEFPDRHVFWGPLAPPARRDVAIALASLGFRFDGLGGFADGRVPTQRDLVLAVSQAGLHPARIRPWPAEPDLSLLYRNVRVDAAGLVEERARGLTMGEMIDLLGRRAEPLSELWNAWGRVRPLLID